MSDPVIRRKVAIIDRCLQRVAQEYRASHNFAEDFSRQDAAVLNLQRACQAAIGIADRLVRLSGAMVPDQSAQSFDILADKGLIDRALAASMRQMAGFRNLIVHQYQDVDIDKLIDIIENRADDLRVFAARLIDIDPQQPH